MSAVEHGFSAEVIARNEQGIATQWLGKCARHAKFAGPSYEVVEDEWRKHVHAETGSAPKPMGNKADRWQPGGEH